MARRISSPLLVGREAELAAFDDALTEAIEGRPGLLLLGGEAGVGKSRLVAEFAARTRGRGGAAVVGTAPPPAGERRAPFAALTPALRGLLRSLDARLIEPLLGSSRVDLAALLPELGAPQAVPDAPEPFASARLAQAVLTTFEVVARHRSPLLFVIDDAHWADDATTQIVAYLARNLTDVPAVLLVAHRSDWLPGEEAFLSLLAELGRFPGAEHIDLGPLGPEEVGRQVQAIMGGDVEAELTRALARRSSGNPFFVEELLAAVLEGGIDRPPPSVRAMTEARVGRLSPASRRLVELIAVSNGPIPTELLAAVTEMPGEAFDAAVRGARDAGLITGQGVHGSSEGAQGAPKREPGDAEHEAEEAERVAIRHVLVREVIVAGISAPRRRELHRDLAVAIERAPRLAGSSRLERSARLASHLLLAGETARALPALLEEAAAAVEARAFITASQAYRRALDAWPRLEAPEGLDVDREVILERAASAAHLCGQPAEAMSLVEEALDARAAAPRSDREVRLRLHLGMYQAAAGDGEAANRTLQAALDEAAPESLLAARVGTALARQLVRAGRATEAAEHAGAAVSVATAAGARREAAQARSVLAMALMSLGRTADALAALGPAEDGERHRGRQTASVSRVSRYSAQVEGLLDRAWTLEQAGDPAGAARTALQGRADADRLGIVGEARSAMSATAARDLLRTGSWEEAAGLLGEDHDPRDRRLPLLAIVRAQLAARRGEWEASDEHLRTWRASKGAATALGWQGYGWLVEAEVAVLRRLFAAGREAVTSGLAAAEREGDRMATAELALLGMRLEADALSATGAIAAGAAEATAAQERAIDLSIRLRGATEVEVDASHASARDHALSASGTAELGRFPGAGTVEAWEPAAAAWDVTRDVYAAAYARYRLAEALLQGQSDRGRARTELQGAMRIADDLGARPLVLDIEQLARRARLIGVTERPGSSFPSPPGYDEARRLGLSDREIEVLALVAEGLADREIAGRLFISTKTAGHHVSHVLSKLDVTRRGEAAAVAFRIGLVPVGA